MQRPALAPALQRHALAIAAALLFAPAGVAGQLMPLQDDLLLNARLRITPSVGWATGVSREETWFTANSTTEPGTHFARVELAGGPTAGLDIEYRFKGPFGLLLGGLFMQRDDAVFTVGDGEALLFTGSNSVFAKAGFSARLHESESDLRLRRLGASAFVAPFYMLEMPQEIEGITDTELFDSASHFGVNFGVTGELPFASDRAAVQLAFEDFFTFWDKDAVARLGHYAVNNPDDPAALTTADLDPSHQWVIRAGISFRVR